jgi:uncharacterized damage-inducible protein DinB
MSDSAAAFVIKTYLSTHETIVQYLQKRSEDEIHWRPSAHSHSIAWHIWHIARWADFMQAVVPGMTPQLKQRLPLGVQIWERDKMAEHWGFDNQKLGWAATGMFMKDADALNLTFPAKTELLGYLEKSFAGIERALSAVDDQQFAAIEQSQPLTAEVWKEATVGEAILFHITHDNRHLGMMESLLGLQSGHGTATI